ncbi:kinetoplast DNA-associated protein [Trypanosoma grayi]|uniref:kinetoplast DNA-associated protein n=1 Tax=Trypanosoma grayi TaxID=71804 RepID=UPI0004F432FD|nr:kinetoplast DNA-associated protein [Trypanosoma grayi]KEG08158.1 kinetoplast DNA-associated protein [Trypanosoma grayi]
MAVDAHNNELNRSKAQEEAEARRKVEEEAEAERRTEEEAEAKRKAEEESEAKRRAEEEAEAKRRAEEEAEAERRTEEESEAKRRAEEEAEARRRAEEEAEAKRRAEEAEAVRKAEELASRVLECRRAKESSSAALNSFTDLLISQSLEMAVDAYNDELNRRKAEEVEAVQKGCGNDEAKGRAGGVSVEAVVKEVASGCLTDSYALAAEYRRNEGYGGVSLEECDKEGLVVTEGVMCEALDQQTGGAESPVSQVLEGSLLSSRFAGVTESGGVKNEPSVSVAAAECCESLEMTGGKSVATAALTQSQSTHMSIFILGDALVDEFVRAAATEVALREAAVPVSGGGVGALSAAPSVANGALSAANVSATWPSTQPGVGTVSPPQPAVSTDTPLCVAPVASKGSGSSGAVTDSVTTYAVERAGVAVAALGETSALSYATVEAALRRGILEAAANAALPGELTEEQVAGLRALAERIASDYIDFASKRKLNTLDECLWHTDAFLSPDQVASHAIDVVSPCRSFEGLQRSDVSFLTHYYVELARKGGTVMDDVHTEARLRENLFERWSNDIVTATSLQTRKRNSNSNKGNDSGSVLSIDRRRAGMTQLVLGHALDNLLEDVVADTAKWIASLATV